MKQDLHGMVAAVTGAGGGIGRATAVRLAENGMTVVLLGGHDLAKLAATGELVKAHGPCHILPGDLTDLSTHGPMLDRLMADCGRLDALVNNAGMTLNAAHDETTPEQFDAIMDINVRVPYFLTQKAIPFLLRSPSPTVVNIASVVAHAGYARQSAYTASKHALLGFTKSLAAEYYQRNLRVHAIAPGGVFTDMVRISRPDLTPDGMIMPEDIADLVLFFLANRGNAVVDEIIVHRVGKQPFLV